MAPIYVYTSRKAHLQQAPLLHHVLHHTMATMLCAIVLNFQTLHTGCCCMYVGVECHWSCNIVYSLGCIGDIQTVLTLCYDVACQCISTSLSDAILYACVFCISQCNPTVRMGCTV